jgi:hypothetical protein
VTSDSHDPRRGTRDNGLRAAGYQALADLDPRVVDGLLATLRDAGIAAYAEPAAGAIGGSMERVLPSRPVDRLSVDNTQVEQAQAILDREKETHEPEQVEQADNVDFDRAWQDVLTSLRAPAAAGSPIRSWPESENVESPAEEEPELDLDAAAEVEDGHFEPPPPPPLPRFRKVTLVAIASIALGLVILATNLDGGSLTFVAILAILGGVASLVWNMRQGPPTDSGWDDGAVV